MSQNSAYRKLVFAFKKILNGFSGRKSRFHTLDGRIASLSDFLLLPSTETKLIGTQCSLVKRLQFKIGLKFSQ